MKKDNNTSILSTVGLLWVLGPIWYLICEAVAASGFSGYSYATNFISDLGVPTVGVLEGRPLHSSLSAVMNGGFFGEGLLFLVAIVLILPLLKRSIPKILFIGLGIVHVFGIVFVGLVPGSPENVKMGFMSIHALGAAAAISGGNLAAITSRWSLRQLGLPNWYRWVGLSLGVLGLFSAMMLSTHRFLPDGIWERGAVYTFMLWQFITGVLLLFRKTDDVEGLK